MVTVPSPDTREGCCTDVDTDRPAPVYQERAPSTCAQPSLMTLPYQTVVPHLKYNEIAEKRRSLIIKKGVGRVCLAGEPTVSSFTCSASSSDVEA
jgi:hypothetical protein